MSQIPSQQQTLYPTLDAAPNQINSPKVDKGINESTQIGWAGRGDELALYMLIEEC